MPFALSDMIRLGAEVRACAASARTLEEGAARVVEHIQRNLVDAGGRHVCLVARAWATLPWTRLDERRRSMTKPPPAGRDPEATTYLTRLASAGEPDSDPVGTRFDDRVFSMNAAADVERRLMARRLFHLIGVDVARMAEEGTRYVSTIDERAFDLFAAEVSGGRVDGAGSGVVNWSVPAEVRSMLMLGGLLPSGSLMSIALFLSVPIDDLVVEQFRQVGLNAKLALIDLDDPGAPPARARAVRLRALEQLLNARDEAIIWQSSKLEVALEEVAQRAAELAASQVALSRSETTKSAIVESALDGVVAVDQRGDIVEFSAAAERIFGWPRSEAIGRPMVPLLIPRQHHDAMNAAIEKLMRIGPGALRKRRIELIAVRRDGTEFPVEVSIAATDTARGPMLTSFVRDVTEQKATLRALEESTRKTASIARTLQLSLLPHALPEVPGLDLASSYHPAGDGSEVGGDFYDIFQTGPGVWAVVIGDVCGKGAEAAAVTSLVRHTARAAAASEGLPSRVLAVVNRAILAQGADRYCTMAFCRVELTGESVTVTSASGGHPLPLVIPSDGLVSALGTPGPLLGVLPEVRHADVTRPLSAGEALVLFTDGVTDARRGSARFGDERFAALLESLRGADSPTIATTIERAIFEHQGPLPVDDIALVVLRHRPTGP